MALFRLLSSVLERIERLRRILVQKNGGKKKFHLCSGRFFVNIMVKVGLGIRQVSFGLNTLLGKWFSGLGDGTEDQWKKVQRMVGNHAASWVDLGVQRGIIKVQDNFQHQIIFSLGEDDRIYFWTDIHRVSNSLEVLPDPL